MLYQRVTGDFYTIISEGKFTLSWKVYGVVLPSNVWYSFAMQYKSKIQGNVDTKKLFFKCI